jgi:hypothetical protein
VPGPMNRRIFLRGLGGACVAAPFLGSLRDRGAKAQSQATPQRLIVMFTHAGCITTRFFPKKSHGPLTAADLEPTTLKHLAPYVDKLLMPRGIRGMNEWTSTMVRGQGNDFHTQVAGSYFTCQPIAPNSDDPYDFRVEVKYDAKPIGPSLDHVMAQQLSPGGVPLFIRVGTNPDPPMTAISYSARETPYPGVAASEAFTSLTGLFADGAPMSRDSYQALRGQSIIDFVREDLATLERLDMSRADKNKLGAWKELLHETGGVMSSELCHAAAEDRLGLTQANLQELSQVSPARDRLTAKYTDTLDGADLHSNLAVLAAACNANPVIFLKYGGALRFDGLGLTIDNDNLAHRIGNPGSSGTCVPGVIDMIHTIDDYYARKFAYLVGRLNDIEEGDQKLLDNTATVWFQEVSDGCAHNLNNLPIVQVGGAGGYFKTGWAVNVEDGSPDLTTGNSEALCAPGTPDIVNATEQLTGTDPSVANAPINKYYCNLMNALGVKAGPDGFPLAGGTAEVTKYGMYDRTQDFIGGGTKPPTIHDPGEYSELRANG